MSYLNSKPLPSRARLHELFEYRDDGVLIRKVATNWRLKAGSVAGSFNRTSGYYRVYVDGVAYQVHRVVWAMHNDGPVPEQLDHKDLDKTNNRIGNLRPATDAQNRVNRPGRSRTGFKGVGLNRDGWFQARINEGGRLKSLGNFRSADEAARVYDAAAVRLHGEYALTNFPQGALA